MGAAHDRALRTRSSALSLALAQRIFWYCFRSSQLRNDSGTSLNPVSSYATAGQHLSGRSRAKFSAADASVRGEPPLPCKWPLLVSLARRRLWRADKQNDIPARFKPWVFSPCTPGSSNREAKEPPSVINCVHIFILRIKRVNRQEIARACRARKELPFYSLLFSFLWAGGREGLLVLPLPFPAASR